jgi:multiple sugar transport system substrate-binding protein
MLTRRSSGITALVVLSLVVAACSGSESSPTASTPGDSAPPASEPATSPTTSAEPVAVEGAVNAFGFAYETADEIAKERVDYFRENHPDVDLTLSESGFDDQQFLAALGSSDPPDAVNIPRIRIGTYIARGVLEPLDDCLTQTGADMGVFYDAAVSQVTVDGTVYAFPEFFNTRAWILNNAAFEDAGISVDDFNPADWESIKAASTALTKGNGDSLSRIGIDPKLPEFLPLWAKANGVDLLSEDGMTSNLDDPKVAEAVEFGVGLVNDMGGFAPFKSFRDTWDFFGAGNQVAADQVGGWPMEQWYYNVLASNSPDVEITVKPFMTKDGQEITYADGNAWAIVKGTDNYAAACQLAYEATSAEAWERAARARAEIREADGTPNTGTFTANRDADAIIFGEIVKLDDMPVFKAAIDEVVRLQENAFALPPSPAGSEFISAMEAGVNEVLTGGTAADALANADQDAQDAIDDAGN